MTGADPSLSASVNAPIAIFAFRRPDHTRRLLQSLKRCEGFSDSRVFVFLDGPRTRADVQPVEETSQVLRAELGPSAEINACSENRGLSRQILAGVKHVLDKHERIIVVEDDLVVHQGFLSFVNDALEFYGSCDRVLQVSGHMFDVPEFVYRRESLLLPLTTTWGWGTWKRAWSGFQEGAPGAQALQQDFQLRKRFNLGGNFDYSTMLERQLTGRINSWGIQWYWHLFQLDGIACFPPRSLVDNYGADGSGTHGRGAMNVRHHTRHSDFASGVVQFDPPQSLSFEEHAFKAVKRAIWRENGSMAGYAVDMFKRWLSL